MSTTNPATATTAAAMVAEAKQRITNLSVAEVVEDIGRGALVVDIREPDERHVTGTIAGSIHAPRGMLEFLADPTSPYHRPELEPGRRIVLHCASGGRSALAADMLQRMGYRDVAHLDGGLNAWIQAGEPVTPASTSC